MVQTSALKSAFMVCLTYPGNSCPEAIPSPEEARRYKHHLDLYGRALQRHWPGASAHWVLEFQRRGAPHYHLLAYGIRRDDLDAFRSWQSATWCRIVGGDGDHLAAGTEASLARSPGGAQHYMAKYLTKGNQDRGGVHVGRYWGRVGKEALPYAERHVVELSPREATLAVRVGRRFVAASQKASRWRALYASALSYASPASPAARSPRRGESRFVADLSEGEFRRLVEEADRAERQGDHEWRPSVLRAGRLVVCSRPAFFAPIVLAMGGRWRLPRKPRASRNSTVTVYCDASTWWDRLAGYLAGLELPTEAPASPPGRG